MSKYSRNWREKRESTELGLLVVPVELGQVRSSHALCPFFGGKSAFHRRVVHGWRSGCEHCDSALARSLSFSREAAIKVRDGTEEVEYITTQWEKHRYVETSAREGLRRASRSPAHIG